MSDQNFAAAPLLAQLSQRGQRVPALSLPAYVVGMGPVLQVWFAEHPIHNYRDAVRYARHERFRTWWEGMLDRGILFHPSAFENLFVSFAHSDGDIDQTLEAARAVAATL